LFLQLAWIPRVWIPQAWPLLSELVWKCDGFALDELVLVPHIAAEAL
jgi:hypothetical protein